MKITCPHCDTAFAVALLVQPVPKASVPQAKPVREKLLREAIIEAVRLSPGSYTASGHGGLWAKRAALAQPISTAGKNAIYAAVLKLLAEGVLRKVDGAPQGRLLLRPKEDA